MKKLKHISLFCIIPVVWTVLVSCEFFEPLEPLPKVYDDTVYIVNTYPIGNTYLDHGWVIGKAGDAVIASHGIGFIADTTAKVFSYEVSLFRLDGYELVQGDIFSDNNNYPGEIIDYVTFAVPPGSNHLKTTALSTESPKMIKGERYWLMLSPGTDPLNESFGWYRNPSSEGVYNLQLVYQQDQNWRVWLNDYTPTLKVYGYRVD